MKKPHAAVRACTNRYIMLVVLSTIAYGLLEYYRTKRNVPNPKTIGKL